jgi:hypothetical protein
MSASVHVLIWLRVIVGEYMLAGRRVIVLALSRKMILDFSTKWALLMIFSLKSLHALVRSRRETKQVRQPQQQ